MAAVYEAQNVDIGKRVAVKVLNAELTHSAVVVERFLREARAAAAVNSPYICNVYDAGKLADGRPFLVLELLEGESLYERMVKERQFGVDFVVQVCTQVARGLTKAHDAGIIHRDMKPENVFLTKDDNDAVLAKILDFGLAKFYVPVDGTTAQQRLTREGAVFGTPAYMSPEQVKGQGQVDHRADLWALGCMVYECLTGRTVWSTDQGVAMIFAQIATSALPKPRKYRKDLPASFDAWFARALERDPDKRFQSAKELADELAPALLAPAEPASAPEPIDTTPAPPPGPGSPAAEPAPEQPFELAPTPHPVPEPAALPEQPAPSSGPRTPKPSDVATSASIDQRAPARLAPRPRAPSSRVAIALGGAVIVAAVSLLAWHVLVRPPAPVAPPSATPAASAPSAPSGEAAPGPSLPSAVPAGPHRWLAAVSRAQESLAKGDSDAAVRSLREAVETAGTSQVARTMLEHVQIGAAAKGPCRLSALGRPRPAELSGSVRRPTIVNTPRGPVLAWADDHEVQGQWHAYTALLDAAMRATNPPIDVTPEAAGAQDTRLIVADERVVLAYADARPGQSAMFVRQLDSSGRITTPPVPVAEGRASATSPAITRGAIGDFWVAFVDAAKDKDSSDLFLQKLTPSLRPAQPPARATVLVAKGFVKPKVRTPSIALQGNHIFVVYRLEENRDEIITRMRVALNDPVLLTGVTDAQDKGAKKEHVLGEVKALSDKRSRGFFPTVACDPAGCFVAWRDEPKGSNAAFLDAATGTAIWRKRFAPFGTQVSVALDGTGAGLLVWYEAGRVRVAPVSRDGVGEPSFVARAMGEQPRPEVALGARKGEWILSWTDFEAGHLEAFAARVTCSP
jgi:serine/threonine-protein kinase